MNEVIPPLPDLKISAFTEQYMSQEDVDTALAIIYKHRPDLFARFAEKEKQNLGVEEYGDDFDRLIREEVRQVVKTGSSLIFAMLMNEARARARLMYGMALRA
jgi:hypothetical protein